MKEQYYFGRVLTRHIDLFAFPRTGSHLLRYCTQGLFDLVALPHAQLDHAEAVARQAELDPMVLYALDLREDGVPYAPVLFDARANGVHGEPVKSERCAVLLIREPIATVYSHFRVATRRWERQLEDPVRWTRTQLARYQSFYTKGFEMLAAHPGETLLLRFEELVAGPEALRRLVEFVGVRPKLSPEFVHRMTRFETMTRGGERTFYASGDNGSWRRDAAWREVLARVEVPDFAPFGYGGAGDRT